MAGEPFVEQQLAADAVPRGHLRSDGEPIVARRQHVSGLEGERVALVADDGAVQDDVAFVLGVQRVSAVLLQLPAQRETDGFDQARFDRLVLERIDLDGTRPGALAIARPEPVGAAVQPEESRREAEQGEAVHVTSFAAWRWHQSAGVHLPPLASSGLWRARRCSKSSRLPTCGASRSSAQSRSCRAPARS